MLSGKSSKKKSFKIPLNGQHHLFWVNIDFGNGLSRFISSFMLHDLLDCLQHICRPQWWCASKTVHFRDVWETNRKHQCDKTDWFLWEHGEPIFSSLSSGHKLLNLINLTSIRFHVLLFAGSHQLVPLIRLYQLLYLQHWNWRIEI